MSYKSEDKIHINVDQLGHVIIWIDEAQNGDLYILITDGGLECSLGGLYGNKSKEPHVYNIGRSRISKDNIHLKQLLSFIKAWWQLNSNLTLSTWMEAYVHEQ